MRKTDKISSFHNLATGEVRHLLLDEVNGSAHTDLILFTAGREEKLLSGTEYETRQKADELWQLWVKDEGFERAKDDAPPYEDLGPSVQLALRLGFDAIYDRRLANMDPRKGRINVAGEIPLKEWKGVQGKNGGTYMYAVGLMAMVAEPLLPSGFHLDLSGPDFAQNMLKVIKAKESVGPHGEFLFAGLRYIP